MEDLLEHHHAHSTADADAVQPTLDGLSQLYPALIQVFVVILSGYACGRSGVISELESEGINHFIKRFALPCMLFRAMATLDFSEVNWTLMACVLIAKTVVFFTVLLLTVVVSSRPVKLGRAGIFAITATQSNDFALGYPIVEALYRTTHPELPQYIYLFTPVSLLILNPIGFCLLELEKDWSNKDQKLRRPSSRAGFRTAWNVLKGIVMNPINFMTFIGIAANFAFQRKIPGVLDGVISTFGVAFSASALFYLGLKMVGRVAEFSGFRLVVPVLLILAKLLYLPLITQAITSQLRPESNFNSTQAYANFAFLYGSIPPAPTVFVFATQYGQEVETVGTVLVLSTFLSGPWMFISAQMLSIRVVDLSRVSGFLATTQVQVGILGIMAAIWVIAVLILNGRWRKLPHCFTMALLISQFMACLGMLFWQRAEASSEFWHYSEFILFLSGVLSARAWTSGLAIALWLQNTTYASTVSRRKWMFSLVCFGVPVCITVVIVASGHHSRADVNPAFHYGLLQVVLSAVLLSVTFTISVISLILGQIARRKLSKKRNLSSESQPYVQELHEFTPSARLLQQPDFTLDPPASMTGAAVPEHDNLMEIDLSSESTGNSTAIHSTQRESLMEAVAREDESDALSMEEQRSLSMEFEFGQRRSDLPEDPLQYNRHVVLVLCLTTSTLVGLFVCFWRIFVAESNSNGIFVELEFLDGVLMFGQSLFVFAIFGLDSISGIFLGSKRFISRMTRTKL
ncbi:Integral membrane protein [Hypsibius exemplaris]|uniref:Integral membrane protein n=1 Tax=Hypsibius exemplaris TaxID=2072580 RepID=A0A1W0WV55_HYPEX|nr:Integral membrane protein [Hypsibius exemplaris]